MVKKRPKQKYWYRIYHVECPVCGRGKPYRERVKGKRPSNPGVRHVRVPYKEAYDYCL